MGYVNPDNGGWTELRVHGVSGTAPESMLQHPHVRLVAGDAESGFHRRVWQSPMIAEDTKEQRLEGYSWGGLTSGDNKRALWLLLLPFMLLNVAFYMAPWRRPGSSDRRGRKAERFSATVQRLLALSFTMTFALAAASVAMDLVGWQCGAGLAAERPEACAGGNGWLGWLSWDWLDSPGRQLAATALIPLAVVLLLWWLARSTWQGLEKVDIPQIDGAEDVTTPLEDRAMWNGRATVRRLRALHVAAALAVPGVLATAPLLPDPSRGVAALLDGGAWDAPVDAIRTGSLLLLLVSLVTTAVWVCWPGIASRQRPASGSKGRLQQSAQADAERSDQYRFWPVIVLLLTGTGVVAAWWPTSDQMERPAGGLPWLEGWVLGLFSLQAVLLLLLVGACLALKRTADREGRGVITPARLAASAPSVIDGDELMPTPAWRGFGMPAIAFLGWLLAGGLSAGVVLQTADALGSPVVQLRDAPDDALIVPLSYYWAAVTALAAGVVALFLALWAWWNLRRRSGDAAERVTRAFPGVNVSDRQGAARRIEIARQWATAQNLTGLSQRLVGIFLLVTVGLVVAATTGYFTIGGRLITDAGFLVTAATLAMTGFVLALLWTGRQAYNKPAFRRTVGIVWDLGTFWPRAVHPLAPPCYAERAIPDLMTRLSLYTELSGGRALLSCHSQGTVLGAAVLLQAQTEISARTWFLTYGAPLTRLYQRFFPAYFSWTALDRLGGFLTSPPPLEDRNHRARWRWRNLYRLTDPIGGAIFKDVDAVFEPRPDHQADGDREDVDRLLVDPVFSRSPGDPCHPKALGHSDYTSDPAFAWTTARMRDGKLPAC